jgi:hypothetical protein
MTDDGDDSPRYQLKENVLRPVGDPVDGEFEEEACSTITERYHPSPVQLAKGTFTKTNIGPGKNLQLELVISYR